MSTRTAKAVAAMKAAQAWRDARKVDDGRSAETMNAEHQAELAFWEAFDAWEHAPKKPKVCPDCGGDGVGFYVRSGCPTCNGTGVKAGK